MAAAERNEPVAQPGFTVWFTGLSGSGKSTLGRMLRDRLVAGGYSVEWLDSGRIRRELNRDLGFTRAQIEANLRRIAYECRLLGRNGVIAVVSAISPYRDLRQAFRAEIGRFIEVYCRCSMEVLMKRDEQGLFERAARGEVQHVAGINAPYEEPLKPEVLLDTDREPPEVCVAKVLKTLEVLGYVGPIESACYSAQEQELIKQRLRDLGYI
ncbi:MAG: adenylyl-sulfate kinase [Phycisphaerae bacterium]